MDVTIIGTGLMGLPMAGRLLAAGHRLTVWNRSREKARPLAGEGAALAAGPAAAIAASPVTVLMLAAGAAVRDVLGALGAIP